MASTVAALISIVRRHLNENSASSTSYWTDAELAALMDKGAKDLWRAINDNFQHYFLTIKEDGSVSQAANASTLSGVPTDCTIVRGIEPLDMAARPGLIYRPKDYNHVDFQRARVLAAQEPSFAMSVLYCLTGAGSPVAAPSIQVAPKLNTAVTLRLTYVPSPSQLVDTSPGAGQTTTIYIPGEADNALVAWTVAYALAKELEEREPHSGWLKLYATEKQNLLTSLTPRQTDEEDTAEAMFEDEWQ